MLCGLEGLIIKHVMRSCERLFLGFRWLCKCAPQSMLNVEGHGKQTTWVAVSLLHCPNESKNMELLRCLECLETFCALCIVHIYVYMFNLMMQRNDQTYGEEKATGKEKKPERERWAREKEIKREWVR